MTLITENEPAYRIGGEFSISLDDFLKPEISPKTNFSQKKNHLYLNTGRSAIYTALLNILQQGGKKEAWLPRYCCQSALLPFQLLGFQVNFYSLGWDLNTPSQLPTELDGETFLFIHYFGKRNKPIHHYLKEMKKQHYFFVIEDCVQALLNKQLGTYDFVVYSYRKFLPQPDGALLASDFPLNEKNLAPADEAFVSQRLIGKLIRHRNDAELCLDLFARAEKIIDSPPGPRKMSCLSHYLLARTDTAEIAERRRRNFFYLMKLIKQISLDEELLHPLFDSLEPAEIPLGLPIVVNPGDRDRLRDFLTNHKIFCPVHWPLELDNLVLWDTEWRLSRSLLTLPLDQRLDFPALDYLIEKISIFYTGR